MSGDEDGEVSAIPIDVGDEVVIRTATEDCEICGDESFGVIYPVGEESPNVHSEGLVVCEPCYRENDHFDDDQHYGFEQFNA